MKRLLSILTFLALPLLAAEHTFGWKSSPTHSKTLRQFVGTGLVKINPKSDLRASLPPVYDQGQLGSCVAHAGLACFEQAWKKQHGAFMLGSRLGLYSDLLRHDGNWPSDSGSYTATAIWVLRNQGVGLEKCLPYVVRSFGKAAPACYTKTQGNWKLLDAFDVDSTDGKSIRAALTAGMPVMFGGYVYADIERLPSTYILPSPRGRPIGGHEMLVVGHDDAKQLYLVRNSWAVRYGMSGHLYVRYRDMHNSRIYEDFAAIRLTK